MQKVILFVSAIILSVIPLRVNALTTEERDAERADALFTKKESHQVLTAEESKWYADYIKKAATKWDREKTLAPQLEVAASNVAAKVLYAPKGKSSLRSVKAFLQADGPVVGQYKITLICMFPSGFTTAGTKRGIVIKSGQIMKKLLESSDLKEAGAFEIRGIVNGTDKYGNKTDMDATAITLRRATLERINWDNVSFDIIENVAKSEGELWYHPSLR